MKIRNPKHNAVGSIDCEIEHESLGWIPFTASSEDVEERGRTIYAEIMAGEHGAVAAYESPALTTDQHLSIIAARRFDEETRGISINGMVVDTSRDSQALITGAALQATLDPTYTVRWKTGAGFVELNAEQIIGMATSVRAHVQACFDRESELIAAVNAGTYTADMLGQGWPV